MWGKWNQSHPPTPTGNILHPSWRNPIRPPTPRKTNQFGNRDYQIIMYFVHILNCNVVLCTIIVQCTWEYLNQINQFWWYFRLHSLNIIISHGVIMFNSPGGGDGGGQGVKNDWPHSYQAQVSATSWRISSGLASSEHAPGNTVLWLVAVGLYWSLIGPEQWVHRGNRHRAGHCEERGDEAWWEAWSQHEAGGGGCVRSRGHGHCRLSQVSINHLFRDWILVMN